MAEINQKRKRKNNCYTCWCGEDGTENELIAYLLKNNGFIIDPDSFDEMYKLKTNGKYFSYPVGSEIRFFNIKKDISNKIESLDFHVIVYKSKAVMPDDETSEEIRWLKKKYGLISDEDEEEYRLTIRGKIRKYPKGIRFLFHCREYDKEGNLCSGSFSPQILVWRNICSTD